MSPRSLTLALLSIVLLLFPATASGKDAAWTSVRSQNFFLVGNASEKDIRSVATKLEQFRETFRQLFPRMKVRSPIPTNVIVFRNSESYRPFKPKLADGKPDEGVAGFFQAGEDANYITLAVDGEPQNTLGTIFHEYVHFLLETNFGKSEIPPWFNEGLAEYYQTFEIENDQKVALGKLQNGHLRLLQSSELIPLKTFFEIDNYSLHRNGDHSRSIFYAQAWALMHYIIQSERGTNAAKLTGFLSLIKGRTPDESAFRQVFGMDYAAMEVVLRKYIRQRTFQGTVYTLENKLTFDAGMTASPLSEAEANAFLGDLLYHTNEIEAAETYLRKALAADPKLSLANTSLGLVKMRQRRFAEAKKLLESAVANDNSNHFAHYAYAYALSRESVDEFGYISRFPAEATTLMRASLNRSIALNPEFGESYRLMAFINMVNGDDLNEAAAFLDKALAYHPGHEDYLLLSAEIALRQQDYDDAKRIAQKVLATAATQQSRTAAQTVIDNIAKYVDSKAAAEKQYLEVGPVRPFVIVKRATLTDADVTKINDDRVIHNINRLIIKPKVGEKQIVGRIERISCPNGTVKYTVTSDGRPHEFVSDDFAKLDVVILIEGEQTIEVGCDARLSSLLAVINYKSVPVGKAAAANTVTALSFVPEIFRLKTPAELAAYKEVIIEDDSRLSRGGDPAINRAERYAAIAEAMRKPAAGESRLVGTMQKIECEGREMIFNVVTASHTVGLRLTHGGNAEVKAYTPDAEGVRIGCGVTPPPVRAVITYRPASDGQAAELRSVEFVPDGFELRN